MALGSRQNANTIFLNIIGGKITQRVNEGTEGAKSRKLEKGPKSGTEVWEVEHDFVSGKIVDGGIKESEYGDRIELKLQDKDEYYVLTVNWDYSKLRDAIVKRLPNLDVEKPVEISCFPDRDTGQPVLMIRQGGEVVKYFWTRDQPGDLPEPTQKKVRNKVEWDWTDVDNFLFKEASDWFSQFEGDQKPAHQEAASDDYEEEEKKSSTGEDTLDEDVPF